MSIRLRLLLLANVSSLLLLLFGAIALYQLGVLNHGNQVPMQIENITG